MNQDKINVLVDYVFAQLESGSSEEAIEQALLHAGYDMHVVDQVFEIVETEINQSNEPSAFEQAVQTHDENSGHLIDGVFHWLKHNSLFRGRLDRTGYLIAHLVIFGLTLVIALLLVNDAYSRINMPGETISGVSGNFSFMVTLFLAIPGNILLFSLYVRRLHDIGSSGWLSLLTFVPFINFAMYCIMLFKPGQQGGNAYGTTRSARGITTLLGVGIYREEQKAEPSV